MELESASTISLTLQLRALTGLTARTRPVTTLIRMIRQTARTKPQICHMVIAGLTAMILSNTMAQTVRLGIWRPIAPFIHGASCLPIRPHVPPMDQVATM